VTLDCPNNRYVNDERICIALASMWAQIKVKVRVNAMPKANYFPKQEKLDVSMYMLGWGGSITDPETTFTPIYRNRGEKGVGEYNRGNFKDDARCARRCIEQGSRPGEAQGADQESLPAPQRDGPPHPAAPAVHPVGGSVQCDGGAPCRQLARDPMGHRRSGEVVVGRTQASNATRPSSHASGASSAGPPGGAPWGQERSDWGANVSRLA
jgi:hypothetical protein